MSTQSAVPLRSPIRVTQREEALVAGRAMCDVVPRAVLVVLVLICYAVRICSEVLDDRFAGTIPPVGVRIASQYRALNLVL